MMIPEAASVEAEVLDIPRSGDASILDAIVRGVIEGPDC